LLPRDSGSSREAALIAVRKLRRLESVVTTKACQIALKERCDVCGIAAIEKVDVVTSEQQREE
jgi:hypothetical protein